MGHDQIPGRWVLTLFWLVLLVAPSCSEATDQVVDPTPDSVGTGARLIPSSEMDDDRVVAVRCDQSSVGSSIIVTLAEQLIDPRLRTVTSAYVVVGTPTSDGVATPPPEDVLAAFRQWAETDERIIVHGVHVGGASGRLEVSVFATKKMTEVDPDALALPTIAGLRLAWC